MSQRKDQRDPTRVDLDAYNKALKLGDHIMSVAKPKDRNVNTHHIPKRNAGLGHMLMNHAVAVGADILEANEIYVGANMLPKRIRKNYKKRIELQERAIRKTYRIEHIFRILHFDRPFAESTSSYMMDLICETRDLLVRWRESDKKALKRLEKNLQEEKMSKRSEKTF